MSPAKNENTYPLSSSFSAFFPTYHPSAFPTESLSRPDSACFPFSLNTGVPRACGRAFCPFLEHNQKLDVSVALPSHPNTRRWRSIYVQRLPKPPTIIFPISSSPEPVLSSSPDSPRRLLGLCPFQLFLVVLPDLLSVL